MGPRPSVLLSVAFVSGAAALVARAWPAFAARLLAGANSAFAAALPYAADGAAMVRLSALSLAGRDEEFDRELHRLRARLPAELLGTHDPTAAEMWPH
jgi:hypothetical protein